MEIAVPRETVEQESNWTEVIEPRHALLDWRLKEAWHYRDLLFMFVKRDFVATYKQTILGPLWFFVQPVLTTIMFTIIFGRFAGMSSDNLPKIVFYFSGITIWNYFSETFNKTSTVFKDHSHLFGKVYFPRILMPLSIIVSGLVRFFIQFILFIAIVLYYTWQPGSNVHPNMYILLTPFLLLLMAGFALGAGMIISAFTTKYRDLTFLLSFGVQLLMYATPVIYSVNTLPEKYKAYSLANPLSSIVETFRYAYLGSGHISFAALAYSTAWMLGLLFFGILIFNKVEKTFMDTV